MSRIRSVHPGFFRDENLVACSAFARLLYIGLGVEADDKGIFEWKPVQLKMSIFPGDSVDVAPLLEELVAAGNVRRFEAAGRAFGAIRNFRKYQRPKTPNNVHPMPSDIAEYVAFPQKGEMASDDVVPLPANGPSAPQMEDGGGKMEDESKPPASVPISEARALFDQVWKAFPQNPTSNEDKAEKAFNATKATDQPLILAAALRRRQWFVEDCETRKRTEDEGLKFEPHLSTWITSGDWRKAEALPLRSEAGKADPSLAVIVAGDEDFIAITKLRDGKAPVVGNSGKATVTIAELERARQQQELVH